MPKFCISLYYKFNFNVRHLPIFHFMTSCRRRQVKSYDTMISLWQQQGIVVKPNSWERREQIATKLPFLVRLKVLKQLLLSFYVVMQLNDVDSYCILPNSCQLLLLYLNAFQNYMSHLKKIDCLILKDWNGPMSKNMIFPLGLKFKRHVLVSK